MDRNKALKMVRNELIKNDINIHSLNPKSIEHLIDIEMYLCEEHEAVIDKVKYLNHNQFTIKRYGEQRGLSRQYLYKAQNKLFIGYFNNRSSFYKEKKNQEIQNLIGKNENDLVKQINLLLENQVKFMELKDENNKLKKEILRLRKQLKDISKTLS